MIFSFRRVTLSAVFSFFFFFSLLTNKNFEDFLGRICCLTFLQILLERNFYWIPYIYILIHTSPEGLTTAQSFKTESTTGLIFETHVSCLPLLTCKYGPPYTLFIKLFTERERAVLIPKYLYCGWSYFKPIMHMKLSLYIYIFRLVIYYLNRRRLRAIKFKFNKRIFFFKLKIIN